VRSLLFRVADDDFVMVLVAGPQQIPWRVLRRRLNQNRLTTADRDDVVRVTGYQIGAVSPFGVPQPLRVLVDAGVLRPSEISIGSGERGVTVILDSAELRRALDLSPNAVEYVDLTQ
jgi:prolyl-tRNA editing enzyme YbaK/EbsC (Cys-tRNA(Pro) deacylase)